MTRLGQTAAAGCIICLVTLATGLLGGCVFSYPTDLRLVSVEKVNRATETEVPGFYEDGKEVRPSEPALKVTFSSRTNLLEYAHGNARLFAEGEFCNSADKLPDFVGSPPPNLMWDIVYSQNINLSDLAYDTGELPALPASPDGRFTYHAYLTAFIRRNRYVNWRPEQTWDLLERPHDVCLSVRTSFYLFARLSNSVQIPANVIRAALQ